MGRKVIGLMAGYLAAVVVVFGLIFGAERFVTWLETLVGGPKAIPLWVTAVSAALGTVLLFGLGGWAGWKAYHRVVGPLDANGVPVKGDLPVGRKLLAGYVSFFVFTILAGTARRVLDGLIGGSLIVLGLTHIPLWVLRTLEVAVYGFGIAVGIAGAVRIYRWGRGPVPAASNHAA